MNAAELLSLVRDALATAGVGEAEVYARVRERGFARFAMGDLGQHMHVSEVEITARAASGKSIAEATTNRLDRDGIIDVLRRAEASARLSPPNPDFDGFEGAHAASSRAIDPPRFSAKTLATSAEERVALLAPCLSAVQDAGFVSAGLLETSVLHETVATTRGCERKFDSTAAHFKIWATETPGAGGAAGYGGATHRDVSALDLSGETERAIRICRDSKSPIAIDAGAYDVVMEPEAVSELLEWLAATAFAAPEVEQGVSAVAGRKGERVTGDSVTIVEDPLDATDLGFGTPFDREGVDRTRVTLLERGVARDILFDRAHARRMGARSTGSAVPPGFGAEGGVGGTAIHLAPGGAASVGELVAGVERGLYVCRLHYVNGFVEPRRAVMTGLTRDGCFLIERGKITRPVGNLRFTESFLEALSRADGMTAHAKAIPTWWSEGGATVTPAVRMRAFRFTGGSQAPS